MLAELERQQAAHGVLDHRGECRATGLWFSAHPLDVFVPPAARAGATAAAELPQLARRQVAVVGMPCAYRRVETKSGGSSASEIEASSAKAAPMEGRKREDVMGKRDVADD